MTHKEIADKLLQTTIEELIKVGYLRRYTSNGTKYYSIDPKWDAKRKGVA